jgi:hypothetical protein
VTSVPPRACVEYKPTTPRRALLTVAVAGPAAERMAKGGEADDTLDASVNQFFEQLGDESIDSFRADGLAAAAEEDDLDLVIPLIESYSSRGKASLSFARLAPKPSGSCRSDGTKSKSSLGRSWSSSVPRATDARTVLGGAAAGTRASMFF